MEAEKCRYRPQELVETVFENELKLLELDIPKIGDKCDKYIGDYLIQFKVEDGKPEDYPGGRKPGVIFKVPGYEASILLGCVDGSYHIKTKKPFYTIAGEDTLENVRDEIANKPSTYYTNNIRLTIEWIADLKNNSIVYKKD